MLPRTLRRTALSLGAGVLAAAPLAACGTGPVASAAPLPVVQPSATDLPPECVDAFPLVVLRADLADLDAVPADWPEPPVPGTLCETSTTPDDAEGVAGYATDADAATVLDAYEAALDGYEVVREEQGTGELLVATGPAGTVEVSVPAPGTYSVFFGPA